MHEISNKVDFYITNVCNLTCDRCNRFNNHNFKGWQRWSDYEADYTEWAKKVKLTSATIMGGEPFLNPTLVDWVQGLNRLFDIDVQVLTNGTRFQYVKNLYDAMLYRSTKSGAMNHIGVSLHNLDDTEEILSNIRKFFRVPFKEYPKGAPENIWNADWHFIDNNRVMINVYIVNQFMGASIIPTWSLTPTLHRQYRLHNTDPHDAHQNCAFAQHKSYHFIKGRLYKCGPAALMPEFDRQFTLQLSYEDRLLLNSYRSLGLDNFDSFHQEFFDTLDNPIPQCKFCPGKHTAKLIAPIQKGL